MRGWTVALALLLAAPGCLGGGAPATPTPDPTPTPGPATPPSPSPSPTPSPSPEPTVPSGSPVPPQPKVVYERTFDFSTEGDVTGKSPKTYASEPVGEEFTLLTVNLSIVRSSAAPTGLPVSGTINSPVVRIFDPSGEEILAASEEGTAEEFTLPAKVGTYTVRHEGAGTLEATVRLTASS